MSLANGKKSKRPWSPMCSGVVQQTFPPLQFSSQNSSVLSPLLHLLDLPNPSVIPTNRQRALASSRVPWPPRAPGGVVWCASPSSTSPPRSVLLPASCWGSLVLNWGGAEWSGAATTRIDPLFRGILDVGQFYQRGVLMGDCMDVAC